MSEVGAERAANLAAVEGFRGRKVLVVGDVMLDRYWFGTVSRVSPEAPVPVVSKTRSAVAPGGAANVAANIASLGGVPFLVGLVGGDEAARELRAVLDGHGIHTEHLVADPGRPTTIKTRIVAHGQHVVRVDEENAGPAAPSLRAAVEDHLRSLLPAVDVVVVSDYAKGFCQPALLGRLLAMAHTRGRRTIIDPKGFDYARYDGAYVITPNRQEALAAARVAADEPGSVETAGARLLAERFVEAVLITKGEEGMALFERDRDPVYYEAIARTVYDVTGAGDTVVATMSLALAAGAPLPRTAYLANLAAGMAVEQVGTSAVTLEELRVAILDGRPGPR
jgi:rfaE bifunctional protein kinase chain/domain